MLGENDLLKTLFSYVSCNFIKLLYILLSIDHLLVYVIISVYKEMTIMKTKDKKLVLIPDGKGFHVKSAIAKGEEYVYKYVKFSGGL